MNPGSPLHPAAVRAHPGGRWQERAESLPFGSSSVLVIGHIPPHTAGAVLICSPPLAERPVTQSTERALATGLAAAGMAAFRFHYRGEEGGPAELSLDSMGEDAARVAGWALEAAGVTDLVVVGVGLGGIAAAGVSASGSTPLVLWDAVADPRHHFLDVARAEAMRRYGVEPDPEAEWSLLDQIATDMLDEAMAARGVLDVGGFALSRSLYLSGFDTTLAGAVGGGPRPVLIVEGAGSGSALRTALEGAGCEVDEAAADRKAATTAGRVDHLAVESAVGWIRSHIGGIR